METLSQARPPSTPSTASSAIASRGPVARRVYQPSQVGSAPRPGACQATRSARTVAVVAMKATVSARATTRKAARAMSLAGGRRLIGRPGSAQWATFTSMKATSSRYSARVAARVFRPPQQYASRRRRPRAVPPGNQAR